MAQVMRERRQDAEIYEYLKNRKKIGILPGLYWAVKHIFCKSVSSGKKSILDNYAESMPESYEHPDGDFGEDFVIEALRILPEKYYCFNNVKMLQNQIDHIVVCPKGVFTIETKNYSGDIYGNASNTEWSAVVKYSYGDSYKKYSKSMKFYNPVKQARAHSLNLSNYLKDKKVFFGFVKSVVVFLDNANEVKVFSPQVPVIRPNELYYYFMSLNDCLSDDEVNKIMAAVRDLSNC
jgi:hypothetical protein